VEVQVGELHRNNNVCMYLYVSTKQHNYTCTFKAKKTLAAPISTRHAYFCHGRTLDLEKNAIKTAHDTGENTHVFPLTLSEFLGSPFKGPLRHIKHNRKGLYNCIAASIHKIIERGRDSSIMLRDIQVRSAGQPPQGHVEL